MSYYVYGHVKDWEAEKFEKYTMMERQIQYIKKVIKNHSRYGIRKFQNTLEWKFGKCFLSDKMIKKLRGN